MRNGCPPRATVSVRSSTILGVPQAVGLKYHVAARPCSYPPRIGSRPFLVKPHYHPILLRIPNAEFVSDETNSNSFFVTLGDCQSEWARISWVSWRVAYEKTSDEAISGQVSNKTRRFDDKFIPR